MRNTIFALVAACLLFVPVRPARAADADPSVTPTRSLIDRYAEDRTALSRVYRVPTSAAQRERMGRFLDEETKALEATDFEKLDQAGRIDYLLLRNELQYQRKQIAHRARDVEEVASLLPFANTIVELEQSRRRVVEVDPEQCAKALTDISRQVS